MAEKEKEKDQTKRLCERQRDTTIQTDGQTDNYFNSRLFQSFKRNDFLW